MPSAERPILLSGGSGLLGQALRTAATRRGRALLAPPRAALDITCAATVRAAMRALRPALVINAAGFTAVDAAEQDADACFGANADGPRHLAEACAALGAELIHLSTDYVFDGASRLPYAEDDAPAPLGVYGHSKLAGEQAIRSCLRQHVILRTAWLHGTTGRSFVRSIVRQHLAGRVPRVVVDQVGSPTPAPALAEAILHIADRILRGDAVWGTFHLAGEPAQTWHGLAAAVLRCLDAPEPPAAVTSLSYPTPAARPAWSVLDCARVQAAYGLRPILWQDALPGIVRSLAAEERAGFTPVVAAAAFARAGSGRG